MQVALAVREPRSRYILTATIDGREYDVGETMIGPASEVEATCAILRQQVSENLRRMSCSEGEIGRAGIVIAAAPFLY